MKNQKNQGLAVKTSANSIIEIATGNHKEVPENWMPASGTRAFFFDDPGSVWLKYHGKEHGFKADESGFLDFIFEKGRQFQDKWVKEVAKDAIVVCKEAYEVKNIAKVQETLELIKNKKPIIAQAALWWAPEKIHGVPDFIVHTSWIKEKFPNLLNKENISDHYVVFDIKFTTKLEESGKTVDFENYSAQVRLYTYMLGHFQGLMPKHAYLITRDQILDPIPVDIISKIGHPLDGDLAAVRDRFLEIKINGAKYHPWRDEIVWCDPKTDNSEWEAAKNIIANEKTPGRDTALLYKITHEKKLQLAQLGFPNLNSLLEADPQNIPFENCKGLGEKTSKQIRSILKANKSGSPVIPPSDLVPKKKEFEFFIDFEYFQNINVDFEKQWPDLKGCEMIFMIGAGWEEKGKWCYQHFISAQENYEQEGQMLESFINFLCTKTKDNLKDKSKTALYHWSHPESWQSTKAAGRHNFHKSNLLTQLPLFDLQKVFYDGPCALPGALAYGLKKVAQALGKMNPDLDPKWPDELDEGMTAMLIGWKAYKKANPLESDEMKLLNKYLEADCRALWMILRWLRASKQEKPKRL